MKKENLNKALRKLIEDWRKRLEAQAKIDKTHATGRFSKSFDGNLTEDGLNITSNVDYAYAVDEGAKANQTTRIPNIGKITEWARHKRLRPYRKLASGGTKFVKVTDASMKSMAYMISKTIKEKGTIKRFGYKGSGIFDTVYKSIRNKIGSDIEEAYGKDIREELQTIINKMNK